MLPRLAATVMLLTLFAGHASAQGSDSSGASIVPAVAQAADNASPDDGAAANLGAVSRMSSFEFSLSLVILGFGVLVLVAEVVLLRRVPCTAEELLRVFGITLIVIGALLVVPAGFSAQAIAPAMGLLGTIAGYLLSQRSERAPRGLPPRSSTEVAPGSATHP